MPKILTCPACGAPLELDDDDDGVVQCVYCQRHVIVATGAPTKAAAARFVAKPGAALRATGAGLTPPPAARVTLEGSGRAKQMPPAMLAATIGLLILCAGVVYFVTASPGSGI